MDALRKVAGLRDGPQQVRLHQGDVVELRCAGGAGLGGARVQEHLPAGRKDGRQEEVRGWNQCQKRQQEEVTARLPVQVSTYQRKEDWRVKSECGTKSDESCRFHRTERLCEHKESESCYFSEKHKRKLLLLLLLQCLHQKHLHEISHCHSAKLQIAATNQLLRSQPLPENISG